MSAILTIGFSEVSITPGQPVLLRGQFYRRISESVETQILVNVIAMESGNSQFILCSCDLTGITSRLTDRVRERVGALDSGIDPAMIILAATHTHTAPEQGEQARATGLHIAEKFLPEGLYLDEEPIPTDVMKPEDYFEFLAERIATAVAAAWANRRPAHIAPQFGRAVVGHCRRTVYEDGTARMYGPANRPDFACLEGGNDSGVELLYVFDDDQKPLGAVVNVACPSQVVMHGRFISSDYWGKVRQFVKAELGEAFCVVGICSPAGDQCPDDLIRRHNGSEAEIQKGTVEGTVELGRRIADVVCRKRHQAEADWIADPVLLHHHESISLPIRRVSEAEFTACKAQYDAYISQLDRVMLNYKDMAALHVSAGAMERYEVQKSVSEYVFEIHVARIGNLAYASNPFELFLDYGNQIRAGSPAAQTFLSQLSVSGQAGYLPTEKGERGGHYSAYVSSGKIGHEGGALLVAHTLRLLRALWPAENGSTG